MNKNAKSNCVISQTDLDYLKHNRQGLYRRAKAFHWEIATDEMPANITLASLGIKLVTIVEHPQPTYPESEQQRRLEISWPGKLPR